MSTKNLSNDEAQQKYKKMVESIDFAMMLTHLDQTPLHAIPMSTKRVDDNGTTYFLSNADSEHNANIESDSRCQLLYSEKHSMEFLSVYGKAVITRDKALIHDLYSSSDDNWFDGNDDPNITVITFHPEEGHYWDSKSNALVSLFKMGYGAITGEKMDVGESGSLDNI
ncbi:general stress protein [Nonlabens sp. YIK11]|uniref:pyridoxamine 5'-phosphate oxidase family protein n=1 Tax=Nonlabens sp. YIK11 TaxID=1453349 RepID=UPI0006DC752E|nr:pyridoxamine 5'-phosphate oxidase family protein [Nonlabens sp. YIK11]KQC33309.1 general stress protein [Nonlabens sp. YIK11]